MIFREKQLPIADTNNPYATSIIIPAYNEQLNIANQIKSILEAMPTTTIPFEIIVVDDGSTDATSANVPYGYNLRLIRHRHNLGYGAALKTGIANARYHNICIIDADGTYPAKEIPPMVQNLVDHHLDMVVAARTGANVNIPVLRKPAKWFLTQLASYLVGQRIPDLNSGLRVMRKMGVLQYVNILPNGFSFTTTITMAMLTDNRDVHYIPIDYKPRVGKSKIRPLKDTGNFLLLIIRTIIYFNPLKVFLPFSMGCLGISLILLLFRIFVSRSFEVSTTIFFITGIQFFGLGLIADLINRRLK